MKFEEILPALKNGKKITNKEYWPNYNHNYIYLHKGQILYKSENDLVDYIITADDLNNEGWEVIEKQPRPYKVGDVIKDKSGQKVRIICVDRKCTGYPIIGLIEDAGGVEYNCSYNKNGKSFHSPNVDLEPLYE